MTQRLEFLTLKNPTLPQLVEYSLADWGIFEINGPTIILSRPLDVSEFTE